MRAMFVKPVTEARFKAIVEAYGAAPKRWPEAERKAALAFMRDNAALVGPWLDAARDLDGMLDTVPVAEHLSAEASQIIQDRAVAQLAAEMGTMTSATVVPFRPRAARRPLPVVWAAGIGMAACIAGALLGVNVSLTSLGDLRAQSVLEQAQLVDQD